MIEDTKPANSAGNENGETGAKSPPRTWKDNMQEPARALGLAPEAAVRVLEVWPSAEDVAWEAGPATRWQPGDAAARAPGGLYWMGGQPPPVALAAARECGISVEQAIALGLSYDECCLGAELCEALNEIAYWAKKAAKVAQEGRGADEAINFIMNFAGEYDPQIMHTDLSFRSARLVTTLLDDIMARIHEVFQKDRETPPEIRDAMRSVALAAADRLGPPSCGRAGPPGADKRGPAADFDAGEFGF